MTDADRLRQMLEHAGLSQRAAARELGIGDRMMRYYWSGEHQPPRVVILPLEHICRARRTRPKSKVAFDESHIEELVSPVRFVTESLTT